jgi:hypothetical protein
MTDNEYTRPSFEARKSSHLRMTAKMSERGKHA